jgi:hypothetical protein
MRQVLLDLIVGLGFESRGIDGQKKKTALTRGQFQLQVVLFYQEDQSSQGRRQVIYTSPLETIQNLSEGQLITQKTIDLPRGVLCTTGTVYVGLNIRPLNGPAGLGPVESIFHYGPCDQRGTSFATPVADFKNQRQSDPRFSIESYVQSNSSSTREENVSPSARESQSSPRFEPRALVVSPLQVRHSSFEPPQGTERRRNFTFQACLSSLHDNRPVRFAQLQVETLSGRLQNIASTDASGCFSFDDQIRYEMYGPECWIQGRVVVKHAASSSQVIVPLLYNPWSNDSSFRDLRFSNGSNASGQNLAPRCAQGKTEIIIQNYFLNREEITYDIDAFLNLNVISKSLHTLNVGLKRSTFTENGGKTDERVPPNTKFLARWALVDQSVTDVNEASTKIYFFQEKIVEVRSSSEIVEELLLASENQRMRKNRNRLLVELLPLKNNFEQSLRENPSIDLMELTKLDTNLTRQVFAGPLILQAESAASGFRAMPNSSTGLDPIKSQWIEDRDKKREELTKASTPQFLAEKLHLDLIDIEDDAATMDLRKALSAPLVFSKPENRALIPPLSISTMKDFIEKGITHQILQRDLCFFWFAYQWPKLLPSTLNPRPRADELSPMKRSQRIQQCAQLVRRDPRLMFEIEQKIFVENPRILSQLRNEVPQRKFSISYDFSMSQSRSTSLSRSISGDLGISFSKNVGFIPVGFGGGASVSLSRSDSSSQGTGVGYSSGLDLSVDTQSFKITAEEIRKCLIVKLNPLLFISSTNNFWKTTLEEAVPREHRDTFTKSGFLFCERPKSGANLEFTEKYYAINHELDESTFNDPNNDRNRPFFITLRGQKDFRAFISALVHLQTAPDNIKSEFLESRLTEEPTNLLFLRNSPTTPKALSP